ncbi:YjbF family lipoprotein [Jannaschia sp. W003]|uniref:YjbF family lipoprotein n=1 Tax=Jannaschia sp. W003 TaxID=2867012 RepID=UPI0021A8FFB0|nr:YjbF family lipoprotein [Jannaschia sp. W003]UWQ22155.1 YjbF family lipoprotein [Jannaschia sp. W003]
MTMRLLRALAAPLCLLALAGCQITNDERETASIGLATRAMVARLAGAEAEPAPDARDAITPALLGQLGTPALLVVLQARDVGVLMVPAAIGADGTVQWRDAEGGGLLMRGGLLVGTRGFGFDLLTVDASGTRAALQRGGASGVRRTERRLRSDNVVVRLDLRCDVLPVDTQVLGFYGQTFRTTIFEERCAGEGVRFANRYWVDATGSVRRSEVLVSPEAGVLETSLLRG